LLVDPDEAWDRGSRNPASSVPRRFSSFAVKPPAGVGGDLQAQLAGLLPKVADMKDPLSRLTDSLTPAALEVVQVGSSRVDFSLSREWITLLADVGASVDIDQYLEFQGGQDSDLGEIGALDLGKPCLTISLIGAGGAARRVLKVPNIEADGLAEALPAVQEARREALPDRGLASIVVRQDAQSDADTGLGFGSAWLGFLIAEGCEIEFSLGPRDR
jgi:hypothetical protein